MDVSRRRALTILTAAVLGVGGVAVAANATAPTGTPAASSSPSPAVGRTGGAVQPGSPSQAEQVSTAVGPEAHGSRPAPAPAVWPTGSWESQGEPEDAPPAPAAGGVPEHGMPQPPSGVTLPSTAATGEHPEYQDHDDDADEASSEDPGDDSHEPGDDSAREHAVTTTPGTSPDGSTDQLSHDGLEHD
jgi:hypothetical protein